MYCFGDWRFVYYIIDVFGCLEVRIGGFSMRHLAKETAKQVHTCQCVSCIMPATEWRSLTDVCCVCFGPIDQLCTVRPLGLTTLLRQHMLPAMQLIGT